MSPHRRRALTHAILEIKGALSEITAEKILRMKDDELLHVYIEIGKSMDGANQTEPVPPREG